MIDNPDEFYNLNNSGILDLQSVEWNYGHAFPIDATYMFFYLIGPADFNVVQWGFTENSNTILVIIIPIIFIAIVGIIIVIVIKKRKSSPIRVDKNQDKT